MCCLFVAFVKNQNLKKIEHNLNELTFDLTGKSEGDDIFQANNEPSSRTQRGHQGPAGFLILASGLDKVISTV